MKKLIISMKSLDEMFTDFKNTAKKIKRGKAPKDAHYEIAFENQRDFNRFVRNVNILMAILNYKPKSIYQLAKLTDKDLANLKKTISFFEDIGAVQIIEEKISGRMVKKPIVNYDRVEFDLRAA